MHNIGLQISCSHFILIKFLKVHYLDLVKLWIKIKGIFKEILNFPDVSMFNFLVMELQIILSFFEINFIHNNNFFSFHHIINNNPFSWILSFKELKQENKPCYIDVLLSINFNHIAHRASDDSVFQLGDDLVQDCGKSFNHWFGVGLGSFKYLC